MLVAAGVAVVAFVACVGTAGFFDVQAPGSMRNVVIARLVLLAALFGLALWLPPVLRRVTRLGWVAFAGFAAWLGFWLLGQWPGLVERDAASAVADAHHGVINEWFSYLHPLLHMAVLEVVPHLGFVAVLQVVGAAAFFAYVATWIHERSRSLWPVGVFAVLVVGSIPVAVFTIDFTRDTIFSYLQMALAVYVARVVVERRRLSRTAFLGIAAITGFLAVYRSEGLVLVLVVPIVIFLALSPPRRVALAGAGVFAAAVVAFAVVLPATLVVSTAAPFFAGQSVKDMQSLLLRANALGAVLSSEFETDDRDRDLAQLGRVLDLPLFLSLQRPNNVAIWAGGFRGGDADDWEAFRTTSNRLLRDNLATVIASRVDGFARVLGLGQAEYYGPESIPPTVHRGWPEFGPRVLAASSAEPPIVRLYFAQRRFLAPTIDYRGLTLSGTSLFWNLIPSLTVLIGALTLARRAPAEAAIGAIVLARLAAQVLLAPVPRWQYYDALLLGGLAVMGLLLARLAERRDAGRGTARRAREMLAAR